MKTIRKGSDIVVRWRIFRYGQEYDIALYRESISLVLSNMGEKKEITDYSIVDVNTIVFKYRAEDQGLGIYRLLLIDKSRNSTRIIEECNAFRLVNTSDAANNGGTLESAITITLTSELTAPADGLSAYEVALQNGFIGTEEEWLQSLKGEQGPQGIQGDKGDKGDRGEQGEKGLSAYQVAIANGFVGTEAEWLQSLVPDTTDIELAEAQRQAKELERIEAENARQSAELERQNASTEAVASANAAASNANAAASSAQQKAEEANAAASSANAVVEGFNSIIVQGTGDAQDKVMSQKAVTDAMTASQAKLSELDAKIGENNGVVCEGTFAKNTVLFTLEDVNIGDTLYLERSAGHNLVTFYDANNVEIENVSVYPSTTQVPVGFAKAVLDYGTGSSTIKVIDKSQMNYRVSKLETDVPAIEGNVNANIAPLIEVATGHNITADLDITNIDDTNPPKTTYIGWDFQIGFFDPKGNGNVLYDSGDVVSNFVKVFPLATYQYNGKLSGNRIAFYDEDMNLIVNYDNTYYGAITGFDFIVPKGCYYARFGCAKNKLSDFSIIFKSKTIVSNNLTGGKRYSVLTKFSDEVGDVAWKEISAYTDVKCDLTKANEVVMNGIEVVRAADTNIQPCFKYVRNVGDKYSIHLKVKFPSDVHDLEEVSQILDVDRLTDSSYNKQILLKKAKTTTIDTAPKFPVAKYNACIQIATGGHVSESIIPDGWTKDYLLGADAMSIRYTGDCSVASNQDIRLSIGSGILRIYHDSNDSTIASFTLSSYNSMVALFQALETATELGGTLEDFEVKQLNIDLAISDIIECDVALVTQYDDGNSGTFYDAFPFYFTTKEKNRIYDIEYIVDETYENNNYHGTMAVIDGYAIGYNTGQASAKLINTPIVITIGDPDVQNNGVEILEFSFTDRAESVRPTIKAIGIEGLTNTIAKDGIKIPLHWFTGIINKLKSQGVEFVTMHEVKEYENGTRQFPANKNYCVVKYDDSGLINIIETSALLEAQLRNHIAPSCALMLKETFSTDRKALMSAVQRGYDFEWHIHHVPSNDLANKWVVYFDYNTWVTQYQASMDKFFDILGYYPDIWTFHACQGNYNICRFLKNHGFHACYAPFGDSNISPITRFNAVAHYVITQEDYDAIDKMFTSHRIG